jgi:hypothetical protein
MGYARKGAIMRLVGGIKRIARWNVLVVALGTMLETWNVTCNAM